MKKIVPLLLGLLLAFSAVFCSACDNHKHEWTDWEVTVRPTETEEGEASRRCPLCKEGGVEQMTLPALSDTEFWSKTETPPTHTTEGNKTYTSAYVTVVIPVAALPEHNWSAWTFIINPSEITFGTARRTCFSCLQTQTKNDVPRLSDTATWTLNEELSTPPSCTAAGENVYVSTEYGKVAVPVNSAHTFSDWSFETQPSETFSGTAKRTCSVCSHEETVTVPALTDTSVWTCKTVPATAAQPAKKVYTSVYGEITVEQPAS